LNQVAFLMGFSWQPIYSGCPPIYFLKYFLTIRKP
jgi:hypothetical protein